MSTNQEVVFRDFTLLSMFAKPGDWKSPKLAFGARYVNPRITVYTNENRSDNKADNRQGIISAGMDPVTAWLFLDSFEKVLKSPNGTKMRIENFTTNRDENGKMGDRVLMSTTFFGKDENGIAWISVVQEGKPKIKFEFRPTIWHKFYKKDGDNFVEVTESEASVGRAMATIMVLKQIWFKDADYSKPKSTLAPTTPNNSNQREQQMSNVSEASDEDIPF